MQLVEGVASRPRTVLVIDDQRIFADAMVGALGAQPDVEVLGVAYDLASAQTLLEQRAPDVVVLDVHFEGDSRDGVEMALEVRDRHPETRVLLLSAMADPSMNTCRSYIKTLLAKFGAHSQLECVAMARRMGLDGRQRDQAAPNGTRHVRRTRARSHPRAAG